MPLIKIEPYIVNSSANFTFNSVTATGNLSVTSNANIGNIGTGIITSTGNITGGNLITGGALSVTGNANIGNVGATLFVGNISGTGNSNVGNLGTSGLITSTGNITGANILTTGQVSATGNGTFGNIVTGGGSGGNITGANVISANTFNGVLANGNSNVSIPAANGNVNISAVGNANILVITGTGANITGTLSVSGNANVGNLGLGGLITITGNITGGNLITGGIVSATGNGTFGNANAGNLLTANFVSGVLTTAAQPNITSVGVLGSLQSTGNITGGNLLGPHANGNSNVNIPAANGNVTVSVAGNANIIVVTGTGVNVAGTLSVSGNGTFGNLNGGNLITANYSSAVLTTGAQPNITSTGTLTSLSVSGNVTVGNIIGPLANGNSNVSIPAANGNVNISSAGNANILVVTGTGANITGTANITGNLSVGGKSNLGPVGNVTITGGTANYVLKTDGLGNLSWVAQSGGGGSANIQILDEGNSLTTSVASINFTGSGITATNSGNAVTVSVPGNPGAVYVDNFTGNGVQTTFTLSVYPLNINNTMVNIDGVEQLRAAYSISGTSIIFSAAPANGAKVEVTTILATSSISSNLTSRTYTGDGSTANFTVSNGVQATGLIVAQNGVLQTPTTDYTVSGSTITFVTPPSNGEAIQIRELATAVANGTGPATSTTDNFTGNGVQTNFTLSTIPASKDWVLVNYNGVLLLKSSYSVANNILTISSAPSNGSNLEVTTFTQLGGFSTLTVSGNIVGGNITTSGIVSATGNITGGNLRTTGVVSATGNITGGNVSVSGTVTANNQVLSSISKAIAISIAYGG